MSRTNFLFDVRFARPASLDGVGRFLWSTAHEIPRLLDAHERLTLLCHPDDVAAWRGAVQGAAVVAADLPIASIAQQQRWPGIVAALAPDVVHFPQFDLPAVPAGTAAVATLYDLTPVDEPRYFGDGRSARRLVAAGLLASACARADRITTLSHASAAIVAERYPRSASRLRVTTPGPSPLARTKGAERTTTTTQPARFVYVGNHRPHKRIDVLLQAFALVRSRLPAAELVLLGRGDARFPEVPRLLRGPLAAGVLAIDDANDDDVADTIAGSTALVFASVGEGYGFPVVEALGLGTPAIVADAGSLPEVLAGAGLVVPPDDLEAWAAAMIRMATDPALRAACVARAVDVVAALSWTATAAQTVTVWREALRQRQTATRQARRR